MLFYCGNLKYPLKPVEDTGAYLSALHRKLKDRGEVLAKTETQEPINLGFDIEVPGKFWGTRTVLLDVQEVAGDIYESIRTDGRTYGVVEYLAKCTGIVWLIDPERRLPPLEVRRQNRNWISYRQYFFDTLDTLYNEAKTAGNLVDGCLPHYMAFCVTKIDKYYDEFNKEREAFLGNILGKSWKQDVERYCHPDRWKCFGISALGRWKTPDGILIPNLDETQGILNDPDQIKPIDIEKPLEWLLDK
jgi:hypothetical protein